MVSTSFANYETASCCRKDVALSAPPSQGIAFGVFALRVFLLLITIKVEGLDRLRQQLGAFQRQGS